MKGKKVCIGGTFNIFHRGHKKLIDTALELAGRNGEVFIGLSSGKLESQKKKPVKPFSERKQCIEEYIRDKKFEGHLEIIPIENRFGLTLIEDFDIIVVSPETFSTALEINRKREELGRKPIKIVEVPFVLAEDGKPISSSRIYSGEIDEEGNILS
ncbi:MAG: cytidyltransferase [Thermoplasmata archaeon]|nr:MAG: cytidyltransferase [Thermoplasmata archaeon]HEC89194.1 pantetheine-phosphate adenylyltransferase [Thermoplasmatales archaeon]